MVQRVRRQTEDEIFVVGSQTRRRPIKQDYGSAKDAKCGIKKKNFSQRRKDAKINWTQIYEFGSWNAEGRIEIRTQMSEVRSPKSEVGIKRFRTRINTDEHRFWKSEVGIWKKARR